MMYGRLEKSPSKLLKSNPKIAEKYAEKCNTTYVNANNPQVRRCCTSTGILSTRATEDTNNVK